MIPLTRRHALLGGTAALGGTALVAGGAQALAARRPSALERLVNPFGDPWASRSRTNPSIPVATSSLFRFYTDGQFGTDRFEGGEFRLSRDFVRYHRHASSPYHYDESIAKLADRMPLFRSVRRAFEAAGLKKRFIGYTTLNFAESDDMPGYAEAPESYFVHRKDAAPSPESRLTFSQDGALVTRGHVFDIRQPEVHAYLANRLTAAMVANDVDAVLIDYAASQWAFGSRDGFDYPEDWFPHFEENQHALLSTVTAAANAKGKQIFCNGVTLEGLYETAPEKTALFASACNGAFWEQPFRAEWRDVEEDPAAYYDRLDRFFDIARARNLTFIVKQGTYRFTGTETDRPGWNWRYPLTSVERERRLMRYLLAFYLLYTLGERTPLIYTHPVAPFDIFTSEAYFAAFDTDIGAARGERQRLADHIYARVFERGVAVMNNSDAPFVGTLDLPGGAQLPLRLPAQDGAILPVA